MVGSHLYPLPQLMRRFRPTCPFWRQRSFCFRPLAFLYRRRGSRPGLDNSRYCLHITLYQQSHFSFSVSSSIAFVLRLTQSLKLLRLQLMLPPHAEQPHVPKTSQYSPPTGSRCGLGSESMPWSWAGSPFLLRTVGISRCS